MSRMNTFGEAITHYLQRYREGHGDDAFHGLRELDHAVLPELEARFRATRDPDLRRFLVEVIWQHRQHSVIPLLGEALLDGDRRVWREALNGLVALGCPASVAVLRTVRVQRDDEEFRRWVDEAIEQAEEEAQRS